MLYREITQANPEFGKIQPNVAWAKVWMKFLPAQSLGLLSSSFTVLNFYQGHSDRAARSTLSFAALPIRRSNCGVRSMMSVDKIRRSSGFLAGIVGATAAVLSALPAGAFSGASVVSASASRQWPVPEVLRVRDGVMTGAEIRQALVGNTMILRDSFTKFVGPQLKQLTLRRELWLQVRPDGSALFRCTIIRPSGDRTGCDGSPTTSYRDTRKFEGAESGVWRIVGDRLCYRGVYYLKGKETCGGFRRIGGRLRPGHDSRFKSLEIRKGLSFD